MAPILQDYWNGTADGADNIVNNPTDGTQYQGQTFTANKSYQISSVILLMSRTEAVQAVTVSIKATDGDSKPTGSDLCSGTFAASELVSWPSYEEKEITFSSPINLTVDTVYAIVVTMASAEETISVQWWKTSGNPYAGGQSAVYYENWPEEPDGWQLDSIRDKWFETYGTSTLAKAINPTPTHNATNVTLHQETITWENGGGATSYDVYYGLTAGSLVKVSSMQTGTSFTVKGVTNGSPYGYITSRYWRIDSYGSDIATGDVWIFTTIAFDPVLPTGITLGSDGVPTGTATGENNIVTIKKLVAVTGNNDLWYEAI